MPEPGWRTGPQDVHRIEDRVSSLYVERCPIDRDDNAIVLIDKARIVHVPAAYLVRHPAQGTGRRRAPYARPALPRRRHIRAHPPAAPRTRRHPRPKTLRTPFRTHRRPLDQARVQGRRRLRRRRRRQPSAVRRQLGICHTVITGIGASPALGFAHTGATLSFVLDIADLYKAEFTIPLAFDLTAKGLTTQRDAHTALRDAVVGSDQPGRVLACMRAQP
ncbi:hypothetical protein [Streptomyces achromogenes]|uniref:hypothetical protein n=1 Tax=Streptomyces achromogenes TaxID=67255 RepID=UPI003F4CAFF6